MNPLYASFNQADQDLAALVFSGLVRMGAHGEVLPGIAERWDINADATEFTFHLRRNALWQDGKPVTADDVVFTAALLGSPDYAGDPALQQVWRGATAVKIDEYTVRFVLKQPFAPFLAYCSIGLLPRHLLEGMSASRLADAGFNRQPVGSGPYRLVALDSAHAVLEAVSGYYLGGPYIKTIEIRFFRDPREAMNAVLRKEADGALLPPVFQANEWAALAARQDVRLLRETRTNSLVLYLNNGQPPFTDSRVRQALSLAIDRGRVADLAAGGRATPSDLPIPPGAWAAPAEAVAPSADPARAKSLLAEAGWTPGPDGTLTRQGKAIEFTLVANNDPGRVAAATEVARQLAVIGVKVQVATAGATEVLRDFIAPRRYEAVLYGWDPGIDPDPYPAWDSARDTPDGGNVARYHNSEVDRLLERARQTPDQAARRSLYDQFVARFRADAPSIVLYYAQDTYLLRRDIHGIEPAVLAQPSARFWDVADWYVKTR